MKFEDQDYQKKCVENIINSLKFFDFETHCKKSLQYSLSSFYKEDGADIPNKTLSNNHNLDVLMETGTGKTFTYLKTIFELNKHYNVSKFIIFIPRKAIIAGTKQNIELTKTFFKIQYGKEIKLYSYEGGKSLSNIMRFVNNEDKSPSVLILSEGSINRKGNILKKRQESPLFSNVSSLLQAMQLIKPVIIIDEPHLLTGKNFIEEFEKFNSLYIRFGATFPKGNFELSNTAYILDSISSFQQYLVKKIRVSTIINSNDIVKLKSVNVKQKYITVTYFKNGEELEIEIKTKEDIGQKTGINYFNGVSFVKLDSTKAYLSNQTFLEVHNSNYVLMQDEQKHIVQSTIKAHFAKEEELFNKGIKALSLFFIPNIDSYYNEATGIKLLFEQEYIKQRQEKLESGNISTEYKKYLEQDFKDGKLVVHQGYFSDLKGTKDEQETKAVNLILNEKKELLSLQTPLRFLFSVWALQEGWDNPNVFTIAKLANANSETSKRQQVGRGLRIAVNQNLERLTYNKLEENEAEFYNINTLDVIVSSKEQEFIVSLQNEINAESYKILDYFDAEKLEIQVNLNKKEINKLINHLEDANIIEFNELANKYKIIGNIYEYIENNKDELSFLKPYSINNLLKLFKPSSNKNLQIENNNKAKNLVNIKPNLYTEFKCLWEAINRKSNIVYKNLNEESLITNIVNAFKNLDIPEDKITLQTSYFNAQDNKIVYIKEEALGVKTFFKDPNYFKDFIFSISKEESLPLNFVLKLFNKLMQNQNLKAKITNNPKKAKVELLTLIKENLHSSIIQNVSYNFYNTVNITNSQVLPFNQQDIKPIKSTLLGKFVASESAPEHYLYDKVVYDSEIEKHIIETDPKVVNEDTVTVFAKLPKISIPTPYKTYNPDFAYLINTQAGKKLFLIVEAKGYNLEQNIPAEEKSKIEYAKKFFAELQKEVGESIKIEFKTRINAKNLIDLIKEL